MSKYKIEFTGLMKKNMKLMQRRGKDMSKMQEVLSILIEGKTLPEKYKDHSLSGNYVNCRECHIEPDWLLIYKIENERLVLLLMKTGTHSDLFKK